MKNFFKKTLIALSILGSICIIGIVSTNVSKSAEDAKWRRICDGTTVTNTCQDEDGNRYSTYIFHKAEPETTEQINHPAKPAKTHIVHHPAEYGTRQVPVCIKTTIGYKNGTCALSRCRDGEYSGSTGRGTCSYHGGVWYGGGPWYEYVTERYLISAEWDETIIDEPAKEAWTETIVISPAKEAYIEKILAK